MPLSKVVPVRECRPHIHEAHINYRRYEQFLKEPDNLDWAIVLLFYSALHLVQAHAISKAKIRQLAVPKSHLDRDNYVIDHLGNIAQEYLMLKQASEDARYDLVKRSGAEVQQFHDRFFVKIRDYLAQSGFAW